LFLFFLFVFFDKTSRAGLWAKSHTTILKIFILKYSSGPEKLPGLSRNGPQESYFKIQLQARKVTRTFEKRAPGSCSGQFEKAAFYCDTETFRCTSLSSVSRTSTIWVKNKIKGFVCNKRSLELVKILFLIATFIKTLIKILFLKATFTFTQGVMFNIGLAHDVPKPYLYFYETTQCFVS